VASSEKRLQHEAWYQESLQELISFAAENLSADVDNTSDLWQRIGLKLKHCRAATLQGFKEWAMKQIMREKGFKFFSLGDLDFDVYELLNDCSLGGKAERFKDFDYTKPDPHTAHIAMIHPVDGSSLLWKVSTDDAIVCKDGDVLSSFQIVEKLWPLRVYLMPTGKPYIAVRIHGKRVPMHYVLFSNGIYKDRAVAKDGDFLNYTNGNISYGSSSGQTAFEAGIFGHLATDPTVQGNDAPVEAPLRGYQPKIKDEQNEEQEVVHPQRSGPAREGRNTPANRDCGRRYIAWGFPVNEHLRDLEPITAPVKTYKPAVKTLVTIPPKPLDIDALRQKWKIPK
jgi:hypothetical protein